MRILFLESSPLSENPVNMHVKNSYILVDFLKSRGADVDLISVASGGDKFTNKIIKKVLKRTYDFVLVMYSSPYTHLDTAREIVDKNKNAKFGWITTDYEITPHGVFPFDFYLSNFVEGYLKKKYDRYLFLNLNNLIARPPNKPVSKKYDLLYYGRFRPGRVEYIKKYQDVVYYSTSKKNVAKNLDAGINLKKAIGPLSWRKGAETLNLFKYSLYLEDKLTHKLFSNLGTRFYEGLFSNTPLLFDESCKTTISKSGYPISDNMLVDGVSDIRARMGDSTHDKQFLKDNTEYALNDKRQTLNKLYDFLVNY